MTRSLCSAFIGLVCLVLIVQHGLWSQFLASVDISRDSWRTRSETVDRVSAPSLLTLKHEDGNGDKPHLILHVGPPKTGTTSIQDFALSNRKLLEEDGVYYVGNVGVEFAQQQGLFNTHNVTRTCRTKSRKECFEAWKSLHKVLDMHRALNHTVFLSEENFSDSLFVDNDRLWDGLLPLTKQWRVSIVLTYRRHYERVSSLYYQQWSGQQKTIPDIWPDSEGETEIPSFASFLKSMDARPVFDPVAMLKRWEYYFESVSIFNFHQRGHLLHNFVCQMIAEPSKLCYLAGHQVQELHSNPSSSKCVHYDMIAVAAYKKGLLKNTTLSRTKVSKAVELHALESLGLTKLTDFPLEQLTPPVAEKLLQHSLRAEATMLPEFHASSEGKPELEAGFQHYKEIGSLASVDANKVLNDPTWMNFFSELR